MTRTAKKTIIDRTEKEVPIDDGGEDIEDFLEGPEGLHLRVWQKDPSKAQGRSFVVKYSLPVTLEALHEQLPNGTYFLEKIDLIEGRRTRKGQREITINKLSAAVPVVANNDGQIVQAITAALNPILEKLTQMQIDNASRKDSGSELELIKEVMRTNRAALEAEGKRMESQVRLYGRAHTNALEYVKDTQLALMAPDEEPELTVKELVTMIKTDPQQALSHLMEDPDLAKDAMQLIGQFAGPKTHPAQPAQAEESPQPPVENEDSRPGG
jgi:type I site-specific restriction-modification system R (restriction) subunit